MALEVEDLLSGFLTFWELPSDSSFGLFQVCSSMVSSENWTSGFPAASNLKSKSSMISFFLQTLDSGIVFALQLCCSTQKYTKWKCSFPNNSTQEICSPNITIVTVYYCMFLYLIIFRFLFTPSLTSSFRLRTIHWRSHVYRSSIEPVH